VPEFSHTRDQGFAFALSFPQLASFLIQLYPSSAYIVSHYLNHPTKAALKIGPRHALYCPVLHHQDMQLHRASGFSIAPNLACSPGVAFNSTSRSRKATNGRAAHQRFPFFPR
jgi:hypothetical protein